MGALVEVGDNAVYESRGSNGIRARHSRRRPRFVRWLLRPARATICVSETIARAIRTCGVSNVVVIPNGVRIPEAVGEPAEPPEVLYVGRLSPEKNIDTLVEACGDLILRKFGLER